MSEHPDPDQRILVRSRLFERLDRVVDDVGVGLVTAPAGSGKTALLKSWARRTTDVPVAWVTVGEEHNDPVRLADAIWTEVAAATERSIMPADRGAAGASREGAPTAPALLILDDVHHIEDAAAASFVERLVDQRRGGFSIVVSGRHSGSLPWHRLRLSGAVELRGDDLAFSTRELRDLLDTRFGIALSDDRAHGLYAATEGWAAGICLAGISLRDAPAGNDRHPSDRRDGLRSFLDAEVLAGLDDERVRFLEASSVLKQLDPSLCDLVTGRSDSAALLDGFVECNLFTERESDSPLVFRYHALFAEFLRSRFDRWPEADRLAVLSAASRWYEQAGLVDEAIASAIETADLDRAEKLVLSACGDATRAGHAATVVRWVSSLPEGRVEASPELSLVLGRAAFSRGDLLMAKTAIASTGRARTEEHSGAGTNIDLALAQLRALVDLAEGSMSRGLEAASRAISLHRAIGAPDGVFGIDEEALLGYEAAGYMLVGEFDRAVADIDASLTPARLAHPSKATVQAMGVKALSLAWAGDERAARSALHDGERIVAGYTGSTADHVMFHLAGIWVSEGDVAGHLAVARTVVDDVEMPTYRVMLGLAEARHHGSQGRVDDATRVLVGAERVIDEMADPGVLPWIAGSVRADLEARAPEGGGEPLHPRELEILGLIATGASRREVAATLYLSLNTVKGYLRTAYRKLGVDDRETAIERARAAGLIGPPDGPGARRNGAASPSGVDGVGDPVG